MHIRLISTFNVGLAIVSGITWFLGSGLDTVIACGLVGGCFILSIICFRDQYLLTLFENINMKSDRIRRCIGLLILADQCKKPKHEWLYALYGFLIYHRQLCPIGMCPITQLVNNRIKRGHYDLAETIIYMQFAVIRQLKSAISLFPNDLNYYWFTIGYLLENTKSYLLSLELITCVSQKELSVFQKFILFCYW